MYILHTFHVVFDDVSILHCPLFCFFTRAHQNAPAITTRVGIDPKFYQNFCNRSKLKVK